MKRVRIPLTDINGRDFMTGQKVEPRVLDQEKNVEERIKKWIKKKIDESDSRGKIFIEGLGRVDMN